MLSRPSRVADSAASLTRLARSAPEKPGVFWATTCRLTSSASGFPFACTPEDRLARRQLGPVDEDAAIEAARAQQRRVEHVGTVGGRDDDHQVAALEAVHLRQQLVQRLLALVVAAAETGAPRAADGVNLVDEHDGGRALLGVAEQIADARRAQPHEHLDELRGADGEERHARLSRHRPRQQRLARAGRPDQENAARHLPAQALEAIRLLEELHHLLQIALGGLQPRDVVEGDVHRRRLVELAALVLEHAAEWIARSEHRLRPARHPDPEPDDERPRQQREQELHREGLLLAVHVDLHAFLPKQRQQRRIVGGGGGVHASARRGRPPSRDSSRWRRALRRS